MASANIGDTYMTLVNNFQLMNLYICIYTYIYIYIYIYPASTATLAQRWPNVNPYVGPTSAHRRWANVDLSIGPMLAQWWSANVGPTLLQHRPNVDTLTLGQRWRNVTPIVVCQRCTNIGPTAFLIMGCDLNGCMFRCVDQWNISW